MPSSREIIDAAAGITQSAQGGFELGSSQNGYTVFTSALNLAGTIAATSPMSIGLNSAAIVNNTVSAMSNFYNGTLQPSDLIQISGSALSLAIAAAAIAGVPVTMGLLVSASIASIASGPGPVKDTINDLANFLASKIADGLFQGEAIDIAKFVRSAGPAIADSYMGPTATIRHYGVGAGELLTVELTDRTGVSTGEMGKVSGTAKTSVAGEGGYWVYEYIPGLEDPVSSFFVSDSSTRVTEYIVPISEQGLALAQQYAKNSIAGGAYSPQGNTVDFAMNTLREAGLNEYSISNFLDPLSMAHQYVKTMEWFSHDTDWYNSQGFMDIDGEGDIRLFEFKAQENVLGTSEDSASIAERAANGISSPIAIDMNGDGITTFRLGSVDVLFDLTGDGHLEKVGWLSETDAFLVRDLDSNGLIDSALEMFGGDRPGKGYAKLALLDDSRDGLISAEDVAYTDLQLWQDRNVNGITDAGELTSLAEANVTDLLLKYDPTPRRDNGNLIGEKSTASVGGETRLMADVYFKFEEPALSAQMAPVLS